ncbi:hypothetical protein 7F7_34 [uncultured Caudovirales phage]|uniref:Uncharacterized protein n=1 Tax=uncultured Caudovirales phage TaxID=2100421 RepID=A0A2H4J5D7_9CAUD|nr:hypothetical protein 7F7_34 [uncultured Caudovirales phage]
MWKVKELKDYEIYDFSLATEKLESYLAKYPDLHVLGYSVNHFENANNRERSYILIKYWEEQ